jgi:hypothetical protein
MPDSWTQRQLGRPISARRRPAVRNSPAARSAAWEFVQVEKTFLVTQSGDEELFVHDRNSPVLVDG